MKNLFIFFLFYIFTSSAVSHEERLNSEGCHKNGKTGDYHCHRKKQKSYRENPEYEKKQSSPISGKRVSATFDNSEFNSLAYQSEVKSAEPCALSFIISPIVI